MPSLVLETNVQVTDPRSFVLNFSKATADLLGKPEKYVSVSYRYNEFLSFNGTFEPAFLLVITSLDNLSPERNEAYSSGLFTLLERELGVQGERGYITFYDPGRANLGYQGTTFAQIFAK